MFGLTKGRGEVIDRFKSFGAIDTARTVQTGAITADDDGNIFYNTLSLDPIPSPFLDSRLLVAPLAGLPSEESTKRIVPDLEDSGAAHWEHERLVSTVPHNRVPVVGG